MAEVKGEREREKQRQVKEMKLQNNNTDGSEAGRKANSRNSRINQRNVRYRNGCDYLGKLDGACRSPWASHRVDTFALGVGQVT